LVIKREMTIHKLSPRRREIVLRERGAAPWLSTARQLPGE
jgi:hypothetical protein